MQTFFITGTDTGIGKTYITCQLLDYLHHLKKKAFAIKPIATGGKSCDPCMLSDNAPLSNHKVNDTLANDDLIQLQRHNLKTEETLGWPINGWHFPSPISPHLAAQEAGYHHLTAQAIAEFCQHPRFLNLDYLLIEGAGGLYVPLNDKETWLDVLRRLNVSTILVVGMRLGCLNHALLSEAALSTAKIPCAGWVANCIDPNMLALEENIQTLSKKMHIPFLGRLAHGEGFSKETLLSLLY